MSPLNPGSWKREAEEGPERARLTLHDTDPITGNEDLLSSLFYEVYRGYTIYSTPRGRCCIHGKLGCLKLLGRFVCFYTIEDAKTFIQWLHREGYTSVDRVERSLPPDAYVWLNWHKTYQQSRLSRSIQPVS